MKLIGNIISGEYDEQSNAFILEKVKHFFTESTLKENQLNSLYEYLKEHQDDMDGQILTLYDQMLVRLTQEETHQFIADLDQIKSLYH